MACGGADNSRDKLAGRTSQSKAEKVVDGKKIYKLNCVVCHGVYGDMGASGAHDLTASKLSLEERINVITNGRNTMTAFKAILDDEEIRAAAEYSMTLKK